MVLILWKSMQNSQLNDLDGGIGNGVVWACCRGRAWVRYLFVQVDQIAL